MLADARALVNYLTLEALVQKATFPLYLDTSRSQDMGIFLLPDGLFVEKELDGLLFLYSY